MTSRVVAEVDSIKRRPGHLYFITREGHLACIPRATGHYTGRSGRITVVRRLGIKKRRGFWYYLKGSQVIEAKRRGSTESRRRQ